MAKHPRIRTFDRKTFSQIFSKKNPLKSDCWIQISELSVCELLAQSQTCLTRLLGLGTKLNLEISPKWDWWNEIAEISLWQVVRKLVRLPASERVARRLDDTVDKKRLNSCVLKHLFWRELRTKNIAKQIRKCFLRRAPNVAFSIFNSGPKILRSYFLHWLFPDFLSDFSHPFWTSGHRDLSPRGSLWVSWQTAGSFWITCKNVRKYIGLHM